jgi:hypothetical protein
MQHIVYIVLQLVIQNAWILPIRSAVAHQIQYVEGNLSELDAPIRL